MKILYVPDWMMAALESAGAPVSDLYSVEKLLNTLSPGDVAFYIQCQYHLSDIIPAPIADSFTLPSSIVDEFECSDPNLVESFKAFQSKLESMKAHKDVPHIETDGKQLSCDLMDENTIRFTHIPLGISDPSDETLQGEAGLYDRVIRQLYSFVSFHELASLPVFAGYLSCTQKGLQPKYVA